MRYKIPFTGGRYSIDVVDDVTVVTDNMLQIEKDLPAVILLSDGDYCNVTKEWADIVLDEFVPQLVFSPDQLRFVPLPIDNRSAGWSHIYKESVVEPAMAMPASAGRTELLRVPSYPTLVVGRDTSFVYDCESMAPVRIDDDGWLADTHYNTAAGLVVEVHISELHALSKPYDGTRDYRSIKVDHSDSSKSCFKPKYDPNHNAPKKLEAVEAPPAFAFDTSRLDELNDKLNLVLQSMDRPSVAEVISPFSYLESNTGPIREYISDGQIALYRGETFLASFSQGPYYAITSDEKGQPLKPEYYDGIHALIEELEPSESIEELGRLAYDLTETLKHSPESLKSPDVLRTYGVRVEGLNPVYVVPAWAFTAHWDKVTGKMTEKKRKRTKK